MTDRDGYYHRLKRRIVGYPRWARLVVGVLLIVGGLLGFLPILGFWMVPLGDIPAARRRSRGLVGAAPARGRARLAGVPGLRGSWRCGPDSNRRRRICSP
jgi:hypothetical protein